MVMAFIIIAFLFIPNFNHLVDIEVVVPNTNSDRLVGIEVLVSNINYDRLVDIEVIVLNTYCHHSLLGSS
jgi:hypothetical protein